MTQLQLKDSVVALHQFEMRYTYEGHLCGTYESVSKHIISKTEESVSRSKGTMLLAPELVSKKRFDNCLKDYRYTINVEGLVDGEQYCLTIIFFDDAINDETSISSFLSDKIRHISLQDNGRHIDLDDL